MVGTSQKPSGGRRNRPIHSIPNSVAQPLERDFINYYSIIQGKIQVHEYVQCCEKAGNLFLKKVVRRIMCQEQLTVHCVKRKKYSSNKGEISPAVRGCHYRWPDWIHKLESACQVRSMSKEGCSPDNSACEGFWGRLRNEMSYGRSWMGIYNAAVHSRA